MTEVISVLSVVLSYYSVKLPVVIFASVKSHENCESRKVTVERCI